MTTKTKILTILLLLITVQLTYGQKSEEKKVKKSFDNYKTSILNDKGKDAIKYVDSRTIQYYSDILELVKTADSTKIESLSILDKLMVFSIRHRVSKEDILSFDGKSLFIYAIKSGMVGKNSVANNSIGEVIVEDNFAKGEFVANGQKAPFYFHFYKEQGKWKIDLTSIFPISTIAFKKMADDSGENQNDYLFSLLEMITGKKPTKEIWNTFN
ncbi:hypothetical protein ACE193_04290 [Bernardetia sp. OM2101]|uniref:hypothetical protein n=1 Tax=Bernardetia sp. OM2101 TaxID=3344876 RepID=UPI0035D0FFE4